MKGNNYTPNNGNTKADKTKRSRFRIGIKVPKTKTSQNFVQLMNGDFLTREFVLNNLGYIFFIFFLLILMVSKGYYVNQLATDIKKTEEELGQMNADYVEAKAKLEEETRRTQLIEKLAPLGLKETVNPTKVVRKRKQE
jgi:cell division protein FtsL